MTTPPGAPPPPRKEDIIEALAQHLASVTSHSIEEAREVAADVVNKGLAQHGRADG
jgi:hypothetical protein